MTFTKLADFLSDPVPSDTQPSAAKNDTQAPAAKANPTAPATGAAPAVPSVHAAPKNDNVVKMQNEMFKLRNEFNSSKIAGKNSKGLPSWNSFATSMFQRHLNHNGSKRTIPFIDKLESITIAGGKTKNYSPTPDGVWGKNTNEALINIKDLANMMLSISSKFQIALNFTEKDIQELQTLIPRDVTHISNINETANNIRNILEKITDSVDRFVTSVENSMVENRENGEVSAGYAGEKKTKEQTLAQFPGAGTIQLNSKDFKYGLNLSSLLSVDQLTQFIASNKLDIDIKDNNALTSFLTSLEEGIKSGTITVSKLTPNEIF